MRVQAIVCVSLILVVYAGIGVAQEKPAEALVVNKEERTVSIPCLIAPRKLPNLNEIYPIEVVATSPAPAGKKAHETVVTTGVKPSDVHKAIESLGSGQGEILVLLTLQ